MSRQYAPIYTAIWHDPQFIAMPEPAQRLYLLVNSQAEINYCGVVPFTPQRWAKLAKGSTPAKVRSAAATLADAGFVLVDLETEELWVRGFVKHNKILSQSQLKTAMRRAFPSIHSAAIRSAFLDSLPPTERSALTQGDRQPAGSLPPDSPPPCPAGGDIDLLVGTAVDLDTEPESSSATLTVVPPDSEEEERLQHEVESQLAERLSPAKVARYGPVGNVVAWKAEAYRRAKANPTRSSRRSCTNCRSGWLLDDDGQQTTIRCDCTQEATA